MEKNNVEKSKLKAINKAIEQEEKLIAIELKKLELEEKKTMIHAWENRRLQMEEMASQVNVLDTLRWLLEANNIDEENSVPGMSQVYRPVFSEREQAAIRKKILEIVERL